MVWSKALEFILELERAFRTAPHLLVVSEFEGDRQSRLKAGFRGYAGAMQDVAGKDDKPPRPWPHGIVRLSVPVVEDRLAVPILFPLAIREI